ncbi:MAG: hypothetical protein JRI23_11685 [Deltaproteobacteria bacterium]|jgi:hypothetical protein|nr:hypothetical protein [Deltaproteobacteria bacterium]MBW2532360.1 hypothetical protein [Deltaproteobacteria bacterium]
MHVGLGLFPKRDEKREKGGVKMSRVSRIVLVIAIVALVGTGVAMAQSKTVTLKGKVLHVEGNNLVVEMSDGSIREFDVQEGFKFDIDGVPTATEDLKPGTMLTATVTTTEEEHVVMHEEVRNGKLLEKVGQTLIVRTDSGEVKKFKNVSGDYTFYVDGKEMTVFELKPGMNLSAHIVHESVETVSEREVQAMGTAPAAPAPAPAPKPAPAPAPAYTSSTLPSTGSQLPLVGLTGLVLLVLGIGLGIIRRF